MNNTPNKEFYQALIEDHSTCFNYKTALKASWIDCADGVMLAISSDTTLFLLEFLERRGLDRVISRLKTRAQSTITFARTAPIDLIEKELNSYFKGQLTHFKTPFCYLGSLFQQQVWEALQHIPYGETRSYLDIAKAIGQPNSFRAVALANGSNQLAIIIPCHRVIQTNGQLGGYAGGIQQKIKLLDLERTAKVTPAVEVAEYDIHG